jgi:TolB-like protein
MTQRLNSFERFWKELTRRKVIHVITVYAAVSFVILQLVDIVEQPLNLPDWTTALVIVLLSIGFFIAVFISWIYDMTPAGLMKTKPASAVRHSDRITSPASKGWKIATCVSGVIIIALLAFNYITRKNFTANHSNLDQSIAVLPFRNLSNDTTQLYFSDGIVEAILDHLFKVGELKVISSTSTKRYRNTELSIKEIAKELGVASILEGSVQKIGNNVRITAQLIETKTDVPLWSETYDRDISDIFAIQTEVAQNVAQELKATLTSEEKDLIKKNHTQNPEAYNLYLQGRFFWNKRTPEGLKKSVEYFEKSIEKDPDYALAYAGMADAYCILSWWGWIPRSDGYAKAKEFALKALEIDKDLAEAHTILGDILCWSEWKWEDAIKELKLAIELNPNYATAHQYYSEILDILGKNDEARAQINIAAGLDPLSAAISGTSALYYYNEHKFKESLDVCHKTMEINPDYDGVYWTSFDAYIKIGENLNAAETLQKLMLRDTLTLKVSGILKEVYSKSGINGILNWLIEWQKNNPAANLYLAKWYSMLGRKEEALDRLEKALNGRLSDIPAINSLPDEIPRIFNSPDYDNLRSEPRFKAIIEKLRL